MRFDHRRRSPPQFRAAFCAPQQVVGPIVLRAVLREPEEVLLGEFVILSADAHVERSTAQTEGVETRGESVVAARAVSCERVDLEAIGTVGIHDRSPQPEIAREPDTDLHAGTGRKAATGELEAVPGLKDERRGEPDVVVHVQCPFDLSRTGWSRLGALLLACLGEQSAPQVRWRVIRVLAPS